MFGGSANPYDDIIVKATDENLASEDWALNIEVCDKVSGDGSTGARNAIAALQKRLSHRNPNVQLYALELANTLAQNCGRSLLEELSSRHWTQALERLVNDRATNAQVKKKALGYIKNWAKQLHDTGDTSLVLMGELYDQLRAKSFAFDDPEPVPEDRAKTRQQAEDDELQRVLELSKQEVGGRNAAASQAPRGGGGGSSSSSYPQTSNSAGPATTYNAPPAPAQVREPEPAALDINTATRVRALYAFASSEVGELNFERGDIIKVLDRGFKEWWRGACNGMIGIFPTTYVEPVPEPTIAELQREAQEEAQVFASLGLVDQLLQTLKEIDPSRGDRLDDRPEVESMYQDSVKLQGQINALIKKYSDQKAELEHMNANFHRAMRQYEEMRNPAPMQAPPQNYAPGPAYGPPQPDPYAAQYQQHPPGQSPLLPQAQYAQQPVAQYSQQPQPAVVSQASFPSAHPGHTGFPQAHPAQSPTVGQPGDAVGPGNFYNQGNPSHPGLHRAPSGAPGFPPAEPHRTGTEPGAAGVGAGVDPANEHAAAWDAYYRQQAEAQQQQGQGQAPGPPGPAAYGASPYPPQPYSGPGAGAGDLSQGMGRLSVHGQ